MSGFVASTSFAADRPERPAKPEFHVRPWQLPEWLQQSDKMAPTAPQTLELAGTWRGFYTAGRDFYRIELILSGDPVSPVTAAGSMRLFTLKRNRDGTFEDAPHHTADATAVFDPLAATLKLTVTNWVGRGTYNSTDKVQMDGVVTFAPDRIAGECYRHRQSNRKPNSTAEVIGHGYILARQSHDVRAIEKQAAMLANLFKDANEKYRGRRLEARTDRQIHEQLLALDSELRSLYPRIDPQRTQSQDLFPKSAHVFSDEIFMRHFGVSFDAMDVWESKKIGRTISARGRGQAYAIQEGFQELGYLRQHFSASGTNNRATTIAHLLPRREVRRWVKERLARISSTSPATTSDKELNRVRTQFQTKLGMLTPKEKKDAIRDVDSIVARSADIFLARGIAELLTREVDDMYFYSLESWRASSNLTSSALDERHFIKFQKVVESRIDNVLESKLNSDIQKIAGIGNEFAAIDEVTASYFDLARKYGRHDGMLKLTARPAYRRAADYVTQLRRYLLSRHQEAVLARIQTAETHETLEDIRQAILSVPSSVDGDLLEKVNQASDQRSSEIDRERWLAMLSSGERALLDSSDRIRVPARPPAPTEDEMRRAVARSAAGVLGVMDRPYRFRQDFGALPLLSKSRGTGHFGSVTIEVLEVRLARPVTVRSANSFSASFRMRSETKAGNRLGDPEVQAMTNAIFGLTNGLWSELRTETFTLTSRGWVSPSIAEKALTSRTFANQIILHILREAAKE